MSVIKLDKGMFYRAKLVSTINLDYYLYKLMLYI